MKLRKPDTVTLALGPIRRGSVGVERTWVPKFLRFGDPLDDPKLVYGGTVELKELGIRLDAEPGAEVLLS